MILDTCSKVAVCVAQTGETYACATDESLLRGMLRLGRKGIPAGCVNGGCGVCKVRIVEGRVHALGPQVPQMHGAWDSIPNSMMTNANIESSAQVTGGNELTLKYKDGEQKILVTPQTEYYTFENGSRADLKPGETIFAGARMDNDGKLVAPRVAVSKNGVKPPQ